MSEDEQFFIVSDGFEVKTVSDLIEALEAFRKVHGNLPVFYDNDRKHEDIQFFVTYPPTEEDGSLNGGMPRRLIIS